MKSTAKPESIVVTRHKIFVQRKLFHATGPESKGIIIKSDCLVANGARHDTPWGLPVVVPKEVPNVGP